MDKALKGKIERFVEDNIVKFHERRAGNLAALKLNKVLGAKNPYLFRAKHMESAPDLVRALLDARLSSSEEGSFGMFMEELAVFVATATGSGQKSTATGLDIELTRDNTRYLIAVKSGKNWGNRSQHTEQRKNFDTAVKVLRQNKQVGAIQPTLGICYGKFKTKHTNSHLHIGGQSFWHLLSGDPQLYTDIIEPLGHRAGEFNEAFELEKDKMYNLMTKDFIERYCLANGAIDWKKLVEFVSKNLVSA